MEPPARASGGLVGIGDDRIGLHVQFAGHAVAGLGDLAGNADEHIGAEHNVRLDPAAGAGGAGLAIEARLGRIAVRIDQAELAIRRREVRIERSPIDISDRYRHARGGGSHALKRWPEQLDFGFAWIMRAGGGNAVCVEGPKSRREHISDAAHQRLRPNAGVQWVADLDVSRRLMPAGLGYGLGGRFVTAVS
jgi:hypothetical protein